VPPASTKKTGDLQTGSNQKPETIDHDDPPPLHAAFDTRRSVICTLHLLLTFSTTAIYTMSSSTSSTLAANAAQSSLKRTRILYDNVHAPQSAFLPAVDPTIAQLALARRKRRPLPQQLHWESEKNTALAIINQINNSNSDTMQPVPKSTSALTTTGGGAQAGGDAKPGGILVVSYARLC
jgi:hypothetical protein